MDFELMEREGLLCGLTYRRGHEVPNAGQGHFHSLDTHVVDLPNLMTCQLEQTQELISFTSMLLQVSRTVQ